LIQVLYDERVLQKVLLLDLLYQLLHGVENKVLGAAEPILYSGPIRHQLFAPHHNQVHKLAQSEVFLVEMLLVLVDFAQNVAEKLQIQLFFLLALCYPLCEYFFI
jgi:hypothetical protein